MIERLNFIVDNVREGVFQQIMLFCFMGNLQSANIL